ncbi:hypothetical protein K438DRAFT_1780360 [Mycena galopus ATCC 62051]|nr:hypothetical protein K438DRAFT_1780360 [Mycena galopus ATCC 62051]
MHEDMITSRGFNISSNFKHQSSPRRLAFCLAHPPEISAMRYIRFARRFNSANAEELFEDREGAGSANWPRLTKVPRRLQNGASPAATSARQPNLSLSTTPTETFARRRGQVIVTGFHASSWTSTTTIYLAHKSGPQIILPGRFVFLSFKWFNAEANDVRSPFNLGSTLCSVKSKDHNYYFTHAQAKPALNCSYAPFFELIHLAHFLVKLPKQPSTFNLKIRQSISQLKSGHSIYLLVSSTWPQQPEQDPTSVKLQHTRSSNKYTDCATRWIFFLDCGGLGKQVWPLPKDAIGKFQSLWYYDHWLET